MGSPIAGINCPKWVSRSMKRINQVGYRRYISEQLSNPYDDSVSHRLFIRREADRLCIVESDESPTLDF